MRRITTAGPVLLLALCMVACGASDSAPRTEAGQGGAAAGGSDDAAAVEPPVYFSLNGSAKRYCSAIWVSERDRDEALYSSVLLTGEDVSDYESGKLAFEVDDERRIVHRVDGRRRRAGAALR